MSKKLNALLHLAAASMMFDGTGRPEEPAKAVRDHSKPATLSPKVWAHRKKMKRIYKESRKHSKGKK